jgi:hypothetical protein
MEGDAPAVFGIHSAGPSRHADTRDDSRTSRQTCSTGVRDNSSPELVVVTRCSGNKFSRCQATKA